ncbi:NADPH-dependent FMN reductase [Salipaludibacillus daqingensis]|uniref:NADPH-dependent FMN reductase n=1 Tax=Salipaludibacillus daqingensis TaxID=3041001 RepID=UPI002472FCDA|nr:NAD(P)H-dependent oxidoreductase [Salipaludibacillus daqingensis]
MKKQILGIVGSLRKNSYNKSIMKFMEALTHEKLEVTPYSIKDIPLFNADEEDGGDPSTVAQFKRAIKNADGLLIVSPEYSHGTPGVLKNALDWAGSMTNENVLSEKPVLLMSASPSGMGGGFSQSQLRQTLAACNAYVPPQPQIFISQVHKKLDENGKLIDQTTVSFLTKSFDDFSKLLESENKKA